MKEAFKIFRDYGGLTQISAQHTAAQAYHAFKHLLTDEEQSELLKTFGRRGSTFDEVCQKIKERLFPD